MTNTRVRVTHTVAEMEVSQRTYTEIAARLREAGYEHVFLSDGVIDMSGIGLRVEERPRSALVTNSDPDGR